MRAANKLNRVQSNVTTRIRQLEQHVGTRLFRREGRSIRLSAEGHTLLVYADRLLRLADEAVSQMRTGKPKGMFRLGSLESTAGTRLAPILSRYHSLYPDVVVELATGTTGALITRVMNFELEAAFVSEPFTAPDLEIAAGIRRAAGARDIQGDTQGIRPARPRALDADRVRAGLLLSQARGGMAGRRDARTGPGVCLVSGHDRLRCRRDRIMRWCRNRSWRRCTQREASASTRCRSAFRRAARTSCGTASLHRPCAASCRFCPASPNEAADARRMP